jgi:hypothetical protein
MTTAAKPRATGETACGQPERRLYLEKHLHAANPIADAVKASIGKGVR